MTIPAKLVQQLAQGRVVPFVGSGVSLAVQVNGEAVFPSWGGLLADMADALDASGKKGVAQIVRLQCQERLWFDAAKYALDGLHKAGFNEVLKRRFEISRPADADWSVPEAVWRLQPPIVLTTNYDDVLAWTKPDTRRLLNDQPDELAVLYSAADPQRPFVWHLHGHISRAGSLILAPAQYDAFYRDAEQTLEQYKAAMIQLNSLLTNWTLLFIGFGMQDEYVMELVGDVLKAFGGATRNHFALMKKGEADVQPLWNEHNVQVLEYDDHGPPLVAKLNELNAAAQRDTPDEVEQPWLGKALRAPVVPPPYTKWLANQCSQDVELSGLRPKHGQAVSLRNVYVPVITRGGDVETEKKDKPRKSRDKLGMPGAERPEHQLLQTLAANKSLYLSGPPGSGKTTFCRWLTLAVCTGDPRVVDDLNNPSVWVTLPAGKYRIGDDDKTSYDWGTPLDAQEFLLEQPLQLSKYPVTNGQYARFVDADGYGERKYWSADGWKWCQGEQRTEPDYWRDPKWNGTTQPVVGVTWWEAEAFCRWADCRLPTECEWEAAARGPQGRAYPWGDKWRKDICNTNEAGCNVTTPVGIFPRSAAACGAHDMAGNVWEWCADTFDSARANDPDAGRVLRGGSWDNDPRNCRSAIRNLDLPDNRGDFIGFRVART